MPKLAMRSTAAFPRSLPQPFLQRASLPLSLATSICQNGRSLASGTAGRQQTDSKDDIAAFNTVKERPHTTPRPTDPAYFTGNPNYYAYLRNINQLIRKHAVPFRSTPTSTRQWKSINDVSHSLNMRLKETDYIDLVHRLNLLYSIPEKDIDVSRVLEKFVPLGQSLEKAVTQPPSLDEDGRSYTVGSRKTAKAQCWLVPGDGLIYVNGHRMNEYVAELSSREKIVRPFEVTDTLAKYNVWAIVDGGGPISQAEAVAVAVARGICVHEPAAQPILEKLEMTKIDTRQVERKKTGQPKARKKNTWVKR
eukprot:jgi/Hompol1/3968/HPOL_003416-RA